LRNLSGCDIPNIDETFRVSFNLFLFWLFELVRFKRVIKLTALSVRAVQIRVKVLALLRSVVRWDVRLLQQLVGAVRKSALHSELTLPI